MRKAAGRSVKENDSLGAYPIFWTTPFAALDALTASTKATASFLDMVFDAKKNFTFSETISAHSA